MKRRIVAIIVLPCAALLLYMGWRRLTALRWVSPTPQHAPECPDDVPADAYAKACRVARATQLRSNEFYWEQGELLWTHPIYKYFFVAVWQDDHWALRGLLTHDRKEVAVPKVVPTVIRSFYGLAADMQRSGLDPTKTTQL